MKIALKFEDVDKVVALNSHPDLTSIVPVIENRFYFATLVPGKSQPRNSQNIYLFGIDDELVYNYFYDDFGPLNIACLYKYCHGVNQILKNTAHKSKLIVHYTSTNPEKRANAAYLVASYSVLCLNKQPEEAYAGVFSKEGPNIRPFQDVSMGVSHYVIKIIDCVRAIKKAVNFGFFDLNDFDVEEYEKYEKLENGDLNWILPRKFIAFLGPSTEIGSYTHHPEKYIDYFIENDVIAVIRFNRKTYDARRFTQAGIQHYEMFFPDGSIPPRKILKNFLHVAETTKGALAVHCKAGLGRTGTLIAAYMIKHYGFTAKESISWLRICRPGSVIGPQQTWLEDMESSLMQEGRLYRLQYHGDENLIFRHRRGIYSIAAKKLKAGRKKDYLCAASIDTYSSEKSSSIKKQPQATPRSNIHVRARSISPQRKFYVTEENVDQGSTVTQGDKLNERKLKREELNAHNSNQQKSKFPFFARKFFSSAANSNT